jgi:hypothetical protein
MAPSGIDVTADSAITFTEGMRLNSTGLGIGTSSPGQKLDVAGNVTSTAWTGRANGSAPYADCAIYRAADNTLGFSTASTERMRLDSSGNLGLGVTPSAWGTANSERALQLNAGSLWSYSTFGLGLINNAFYNSSGNYIYSRNGFALDYFQSSSTGGHIWRTAASGTAGNAITFTQAMTLNADGSLYLGVTSAAAGQFVVKDNTSGNNIWLIGRSSDGTSSVSFRNNADSAYNARIECVSGAMTFGTGTSATERARINSGGYFKASNTGTYANSTSSVNEFNTNANDTTLLVRNTATTGNVYGISVALSGQSPNNTSSDFLYCSDSTAQRASIRSNGGFYNYQANNSNLSDRREKTNFAPAKSYLDVICAIPVQTFNYIDQNLEEDGGLTLGVVAQDVQAVAPELVMESNWAGKDAEPKMRLSIYQTDLQYALMKCIQEQQAIIESLKARLDAANL